MHWEQEGLLHEGDLRGRAGGWLGKEHQAPEGEGHPAVGTARAEASGSGAGARTGCVVNEVPTVETRVAEPCGWED